MTAEEAAVAADKYFDNEGRPLSSTSNTSSVNSVQQQQESSEEQPSFSMPFSDEETDVNFVSKRQFNKNHKFGGNNFNKRQGFSNSSSTASHHPRPNPSTLASRSSSGPVRPGGLCVYHEKFKDDAQSCFQGCRRFNTHKGRKIFAGNAEPGRRT